MYPGFDPGWNNNKKKKAINLQSIYAIWKSTKSTSPDQSFFNHIASSMHFVRENTLVYISILDLLNIVLGSSPVACLSLSFKYISPVLLSYLQAWFSLPFLYDMDIQVVFEFVFYCIIMILHVYYFFISYIGQISFTILCLFKGSDLEISENIYIYF